MPSFLPHYFFFFGFCTSLIAPSALCSLFTFSTPGYGEPEMYQFTVSEGSAVGTPVGRIIATDTDMGENTDMTYLIRDGGDLFKVTTDMETQEAVVSIKKVGQKHAKTFSYL